MIETNFIDTEIGCVPADWAVKRLGDYTEIFRGGSPRPIESYLTKNPDGINWIKIGDVGINDKYIRKTEEKIIKEGASHSRAVSKGDFILSNSMSFGRPYILDIDGCIHDGWLVIKNYQSSYDKDFLYYALSSNQVFDQYIAMAAGSSVKNLSKDKVADVRIAAPSSLPEQRRIASALSSIDNLISALDKLIEKKCAIKTGAMQELLGGKRRVKGCEGEWKWMRLGDCANILRGGSPRPIESYLTTNPDGVNWIKIGDVRPNDKYIRQTEEKIKREGAPHSREVSKGDFILSNSMSFGRPYILDIEGCIHDGWLVIKDYQSTYDKDFLYYILSSTSVFEQYVAMAAGSSVKNLSKDKVADVVIFAPISLTEQRAIASVLTAMDDELAALEAKKAKYVALKQGMMQQLLMGKIRLIDSSAK